MIRLQFSASSGIFVVLLCSVTGVLASQNAGYFECSSPWKDGEKITIVFYIERSKFPSMCSYNPTGRPKFLMSLNSTITANSVCTVGPNINSSGACNFQRGTLNSCGCTDQNLNGSYRIEYNFIAGPTFERWWNAAIDCVDSNLRSVLSFTQTDCWPIPDASTTTSTTTEEITEQTTESEETTEQTTKSSEGGSNASSGRITGGAVGGSVAALAAGSVIAFAVYKSYKKKHAGNAATDVGHTANGNSGGVSGTTREKPPVVSSTNDRLSTQPSAPKPDVSHSDVSLVSGSAPVATGILASKPRELPQPNDSHAGQMASHSVENEVLKVGGSASPAEGPRKLPQPNGAERVTPRLAPLPKNASSSLTSVERNSFVEPVKQPLPPIYK